MDLMILTVVIRLIEYLPSMFHRIVVFLPNFRGAVSFFVISVSSSCVNIAVKCQVSK